MISGGQLGYGIFIMVNATDGRGQKGANVTCVRAVIADCDGVDPSKLVAAKPPHMVVSTSPGKWHPYWLVSDCPLDLFKPLHEALIGEWLRDGPLSDVTATLDPHLVTDGGPCLLHLRPTRDRS